MSLILASNFVAQTNLVLPLAQNSNGLAVRVVSQGSGTIGTLTASGATGTVTWSLNGVTPSWVVLSIDSTGTICTLNFTGAQFQQTPYEFYISCTDGTTTVTFPIYLEVRNPFSISANTTNPVVTSGSTLNVPSFDSTVADIYIQGYGAFNSPQGGCNFILPTSLPQGLNFVTSNEGQLILRVSEPHFNVTPLVATDLVGGLQLYTSSPEAIPLTLQAYQPGSFYDNPDRAYSLTLSVGSQTQKAGVLDFGLGAYYNPTSDLLELDAEIDALQGTLQILGKEVTLPLQYIWSSTGALSINSGGGTTSKTTTYSTGTGAASVTLEVTDSAAIPHVLGSKTISFSAVSPSGSWLSTDAIKIGVDSVKKFGSLGDTVNLTLSSPDGFNTSEDVYLTLSLESESSIEGALASPVLTNAGPLVLNAGSPTAVTGFSFPTGSAIGNKWVLKITATNATSSPTRTGFSQVLFECDGLPPLTVNGTASTISSVTGTSITPIQLSAVNASSTPVSALFELVGGSEFGSPVSGAPDGVYINSSNQIVGNAVVPGTYKFVVSAHASGYRRSYSQVITMTVASAATPLQITSPTASVASVPDNTTFSISWGISGNPTALYLVQTPSQTPVRSVTGSGTTSLTQVGSCVYSIYGESYYGWAYSVPLVVASSSIVSGATLPSAPTIATIDENSKLTANWQPLPVSGAYTAYKGWNLTLLTPPMSGTPVVVFTDGLENGGTTSARVFEETLTVGDYGMSMTALSSNYSLALDSNPWDSNHTFPPALLAANVTLDNTNLLLGQTLTVTLNPSYSNADAWQVVFPDNTSTGWLPLSTRSIAKTFNTAGAQNILIQTQNDFSTANPPVKLRRQLTVPIFVVNQQYSSSSTNQEALTGTLGIGGESGFELTNATTGSGAPPQPYSVVIRAIARDTVTNELKLMVATSRYSNASSLLSTMAIDVFPLAGRPHAKELITPIYILEATAASSSIPVKITTTTLPVNSYVGKSMQEFKMQAAGGLTSYSWFATGLPPGLKMNIDGTIRGTPTQLGSFTTNFAVMDGSTPAYIDESTLTFTIPTDLTITTTTVPAATVGLSYENYTTSLVSPFATTVTPVTIQQTGGLAPYTWSIVAGSLPTGISIDPNLGVLGGVPCTYNSTTDFSKTFTFTVQVTDAIGAKATSNYSITLSPAALSFGTVDQPVIISEEQFKLAVPVFGGYSPYTLTFTDDGVVGSGLAIVNPAKISGVAGVAPDPLVLGYQLPGQILPDYTSSSVSMYPATYPTSVALTLAASGGVPSNTGVLPNAIAVSRSYEFYIDPTGITTLPGAAVYGSLLVGTPTTDSGSTPYLVALKVIDSVGHTASKTLSITTQQQGAGEYTLKSCILNTNGHPSSPSLWTVTPLSGSPALPDPVAGVPYTPGVNQYYCVALFDGGVLKLSNGSTPAGPYTITSGTPPNGILPTWGNSMFSTTGADCVVVFSGTPVTGSPTIASGNSFEVQLPGITNSSNVSVSTAQRFSLKVGGLNTTGSPVVAVTFLDEMELDLNVLVANSIGTFSWAYPLIAEGGVAPYSFSLQSGTTLPSVTNGVLINSLPAFSSTNSALGPYVVSLVASDSSSPRIVSAPVNIDVVFAQSTSKTVHILANNLPTYLYVNKVIPANTYYVQSDLIANWSATGLPAGVTLSPAPGNIAYLQGTPTSVSTGTTPTIITATTFGTSANASVNIAVRAQSATLLAPSHTGATATIGVQYRSVNNNVLISVQYVGFQPGDSDLPLLQNTLGSALIGSPTTNIGGLPTTNARNVTPDGFIMDYDYFPTGSGSDTLTFTNVAFTDHLTLTEVFSALIVTGTTVPYNVSEYTTTQTMAAPVQIAGGSAPYTINITGVSDPRFTVINNNTANAALTLTVSQFATSTIPYNCNVAMVVTDSAANSVSATGQVQVIVQEQNYITVAFTDYTWNISLASPQTGSIVLNSLMSTPQLGHAPYSYYVDSVTIPSGLSTFIQSSATKRVLAFNSTSTVTNVPDYTAALVPSGFLSVTPSSVSVGTYTITVVLRVVDSDGISSTSTNYVNVTISS